MSDSPSFPNGTAEKLMNAIFTILDSIADQVVGSDSSIKTDITNLRQRLQTATIDDPSLTSYKAEVAKIFDGDPPPTPSQELPSFMKQSLPNTNTDPNKRPD
ncbi:MAG: hypothetical protein KTR27_10825 [Leptolyngbyaceae cyanobacterium MAG.088]|nr:hypothetical protein [Leptolyngbyaceae cyanobacterium MAG.088]